MSLFNVVVYGCTVMLWALDSSAGPEQASGPGPADQSGRICEACSWGLQAASAAS